MTNPTALHPEEILATLGNRPDRAALERVRRAVEGEPAADWERELFAALAADDETTRVALVNEQLMELDLRTQRWARVPRVCASIATSLGILLGTLVLRRGLAEGSNMESELFELFVRDLLNDAISVVAFGLVATAFCIGVHAQAARMTRARLAATDKLIEKLESAVAA